MTELHRGGIWKVTRFWVGSVGAVHIVLGAVALLGLYPALRLARFPFSWEWQPLVAGYTVLAFQTVVLAALLWTVQSPSIVMTVAHHLVRDKRKLVLFAVFTLIMLVTTGPLIGGAAIVCALALKSHDHGDSAATMFRTYSRALMPAAIYLFFGLLVVFSYTNVIIRIRFFGLYDQALNQLDVRLFGITVPTLAHQVAAMASRPFFSALNVVYYGMFAQIGAALVLCGINCGWRRALQFVGTILVGYYIALVLFYLFPARGPYYVCPDHFAFFSGLGYNVEAFEMQRNLLANARYIWSGKAVSHVPNGYYIAFPCMHIAQPLIVLWFLRKWKRIAGVLIAYDAVLVGAIVLLEWHYFTDLVGGVFVAATAILLCGGQRRLEGLSTQVKEQLGESPLPAIKG